MGKLLIFFYNYRFRYIYLFVCLLCLQLDHHLIIPLFKDKWQLISNVFDVKGVSSDFLLTKIDGKLSEQFMN